MDGRERSIAASGMSGVGMGMASGGGGASAPDISSNDKDDRVSIDAIASIANAINQQRIEDERAASARELSSVVGGMLPAVQGFTPQDLQAIANKAYAGGNLLSMPLSSIGLLGRIFNARPVSGAFSNAQTLMQMPNAQMVDGYLQAPIEGGGYLSQGGLGQITYTGMPVAGYKGAFANLVNPPQVDRGENVVAPVVDTSGQARCPEGYEFDENLNACRKITPTNYTAMTMPSVPAGRYARMGLLDQPPAGLLEAGFGSPADFAGANLAFRRASAPMSTYFTDPRSYEGYTLI